jgi:cytochrome c-type biogenesis protein
MTELTVIGVAAAFAAGTISFLSPCVLPLVPGYVSYIAGRTIGEGPPAAGLAARLPALGMSLCFVLGFSTVFVALGASASLLGQVLLANRYELNIVGGIIVILFGLLTAGVLRPMWLLRDTRFQVDLPGGHPVGAYVLGLAFAFGWSPCIGPILGAILTVSASATQLSEGITLLAVYAAGLGLPFLLAALFTDRLARRLRAAGRIGRSLQVAAGFVMVLMGVAMVTDRLSMFAFWMLDTFPILGRIG